ncbi:MAG: STAS/SEC14 domain-containing protein [Cyclobacteriaceae bacterium]
MVHMDENYLKISYDADAACVIMQWKSFATSEEFRHGLNEGLKLIQQKKATNWMADMRKMEAIDPEDEQWSNENWFPRALQAGINRMALVPSEDIFNSISVENIMASVAGTSLITHYFQHPDEAKAWLKEAKLSAVTK